MMIRVILSIILFCVVTVETDAQSVSTDSMKNDDTDDDDTDDSRVICSAIIKRRLIP